MRPMRLFNFKSLALATAAMAACAAGAAGAAGGSMKADERASTQPVAAFDAHARVDSGTPIGGEGSGTRLTVASLPSSPWLYLSALFGLAAIGDRRR